MQKPCPSSMSSFRGCQAADTVWTSVPRQPVSIAELRILPAATPSEILTILRLAPGGEGVARHDNGETVFVPATAPGDRVEVRAIKRIQGVARGELVRIIEPSPDRREPPCRYASRCGGCDFMHLRPEAQRRAKLCMLDDVLVRVGENPPRPSQTELVFTDAGPGYRSRLRLHLDKAGQIGMLSARSHDVVPIDRCLVAEETINTAIARLATCDAPSKKRLSFCEQIELRSSSESPTLAVRLLPRKTAELKPALYAPLFGADALVVVAGSTQDCELVQRCSVTPSLALRVPLCAFSQVHHEVNRRLVRAVVEAATRREHRSFVDAYAGAGNFTLPLLQAGLTGEAVDNAGPGVLAARSLARDLGLPFTGFNVGDARDTLLHFAKTHRKFDYLVLDPPRRGAKSVLDAALRLHPRTVALIGCDPVCLARDLAALTGRNAHIEALTLFDMFPETHHFETLAIVDCTEMTNAAAGSARAS
jgi:23S rRNA (uracil1939-C5)-methyltransferase